MWVSSKRTAEEDRQVSWRMALYLVGKIVAEANDLSPKEATTMSRNIKYIGMDVHKVVGLARHVNFRTATLEQTEPVAAVSLLR